MNDNYHEDDNQIMIFTFTKNGLRLFHDLLKNNNSEHFVAHRISSIRGFNLFTRYFQIENMFEGRLDRMKAAFTGLLA